MNKCSNYVVKHIIKFVNDNKLHILCNLNKRFDDIIKDNLDYKFWRIYKKWMKSITKDILSGGLFSGNRFLDINKRNNGEKVFFLPDLRRKSGITLDYFANFVQNYSELFVRAGELLNWPINEDGKFDNDNVIDYLYYKHIVNPCRVHNLDKIEIIAVKLHYFPYLRIILDESHIDNFIKYKINTSMIIKDIQKFVFDENKDVFMNNPEYVKNKINKLITDLLDQSQYFEEDISDDILLKDLKMQDEMIEELNDLIERRKISSTDTREFGHMYNWRKYWKEDWCTDHDNDSEKEIDEI